MKDATGLAILVLAAVGLWAWSKRKQVAATAKLPAGATPAPVAGKAVYVPEGATKAEMDAAYAIVAMTLKPGQVVLWEDDIGFYAANLSGVEEHAAYYSIF